ncbi:hypothetical protein SLW70_14695 [Flavobacterium sp. NG2]|uniref:hypothetical protein n=1 Tax=Flavobacterium sp. NG2 TaxID=3097547 RepID=UPI002A7FB64B|nr:hypothetical protein [Flavobacterium sp. NG2]WPR71174.1 hypothetical protein SLW70_14695 [Flavobacterium sp. NG2]
MKKIFVLATICLFTINISAQETKKCCSKKESCSKTMSAEEVAKCKAKCKAEGKTCDAGTHAKKDEKKCCAKKA